MKFSIGIFSAAAILAAAGQASARNYAGSDTLEVFTKQLAAACGNTFPTKYKALAAGEFTYVGGGSGSGGNAMIAGAQDIAPQSRAISSGERCTTSIPAGPEGEAALTIATPGAQFQDWAIGRDGVSVSTSQPNALRCDDGVNNPPISNAGITHADNNGVGDPDDLKANEDDFGASLAFNNGATQSSFQCGTWAPAIAAGGQFVPLGGVLTTTFTQGSCNNPALVGADTATTYAFQDWKDVLRVLWAGADHSRLVSTTAANGGGGNSQSAANRQDRCSSPIRQGLIANWVNIVQHLPGASCGNVADSCQNAAGTAGGPIRHVYRRDDSSGTTDTFLTLLGLNSTGGSLAAGTLGSNQPFCNGTDTQDLDPIRVRCTTNNVNPAAVTNNATLNDETCGDDQMTGLVLPIRVPTLVGTTNTLTSAGNSRAADGTDFYQQINCTTGVFDVRRPPAVFNTARTCPDGAPYLFTGCLTPLVEAAPAGSGKATVQEANCVNAWTNRAPGAPDQSSVIGGVTNDGRVWNRIARGDRTGGHFGNGGNVSPVLRDERGNEIVQMDARMRYRATTVNGLAVPTSRICIENDDTRTIGCLARAADCSLGYAGRESIIDRAATTTPPQPAYDGGTALLLGPGAVGPNPLGPSKAQIFATAGTSGYQFGRKLYIGSIVGLNAIFDVGTTFTARGGEVITGNGTRFPHSLVGVGDEQAELMQCLLTEDPNLAGNPLPTALAAGGFLPLRSATDATPLLDTTVPSTCP